MGALSGVYELLRLELLQEHKVQTGDDLRKTIIGDHLPVLVLILQHPLSPPSVPRRR